MHLSSHTNGNRMRIALLERLGLWENFLLKLLCWVAFPAVLSGDVDMCHQKCLRLTLCRVCCHFDGFTLGMPAVGENKTCFFRSNGSNDSIQAIDSIGNFLGETSPKLASARANCLRSRLPFPGPSLYGMKERRSCSMSGNVAMWSFQLQLGKLGDFCAVSA